MSQLERRAQRLVEEIVCGTPLAAWSFAVYIRPVVGAAATIVYDQDSLDGEIVIDPGWQLQTHGTLRKLVAHELAHILTDPPMETLGRGVKVRLAREALANRVGALLAGQD